MRTIKFGDISLSNLGFGCTQLSANFTTAAALQNLETAFENGITHFDTAPAYGFGLSESILGKFATHKRQYITISTKIGLLPKALPTHNLFILNTLRSGLNLSSSLRSKLIKKTGGSNKEMPFSIEHAEKSLQNSLKALKCDYIDILLLHECNLETANRDDVINFLQNKQRVGDIRSFGVATHYSKLPSDLKSLNKAHSIIQHEASPYDSDTIFQNSERFRSLHSVFRHYKQVKSLLEKQPEISAKIRNKAGIDLLQPYALQSCFLLFAANNNPNGLIMITSKSNQRIGENIRIWNAPSVSKEQMHTAFSILFSKNTY